jgi:hypothetical protein
VGRSDGGQWLPPGTSPAQPLRRKPFQGTACHYTAIDAAKGWESEKKLYSGGAITQENSERIDHFTQRVWRDTTKLGCRETTQ